MALFSKSSIQESEEPVEQGPGFVSDSYENEMQLPSPKFEAPVNSLDRPSAITELENADDLLGYYRNFMRGKDENGVPIRSSGPLMNDMGVNLVMRSVQSVTHRNTNLSQLDRERIYTICRSKIRSIAHVLFVNMEAYEIRPEEFTQIAPILIDLLQVMEVSLKRAEGGSEQKLVFGAVRQTKMEVTNTDAQKKNFWERFVPK
jgi:hypothetical protein